MFMLTGTL